VFSDEAHELAFQPLIGCRDHRGIPWSAQPVSVPHPLQPPHLRPNVLFLARRNDGHPPNIPMTAMQPPRVATLEHDIQPRKSNVRPRVLRLRESPAADRCGKRARQLPRDTPTSRYDAPTSTADIHSVSYSECLRTIALDIQCLFLRIPVLLLSESLTGEGRG
jgi:hypothetical protein